MTTYLKILGLVVALVGWLIAWQFVTSLEPNSPAISQVIQVSTVDGDTAWDLVGQYNNGVDRREAVAAFKHLNGGVDIRAGNTVLVPVLER